MSMLHGPRFNPATLTPALWLNDTGVDPSTWSDVSGNGLHVTQAVAGQQPAIVTNALNGRQVRRFTRASSQVLGSTNTLNLTAGYSVFWVGKINSNNNYDGILRVDSAVTGSSVFEIYCANGNHIIAAANREGSVGGADYTATGRSYASYYVMSVIGNASSCAHYFKGAADPVTLFGATPYTPSRADKVWVGVGNDTNPYLDGDIAEILVFPTALATSARQQVEYWLGTKYGIRVR